MSASSINLLFNRGLLVKNKTMFKISLPKDSYEKEIKDLFPNGGICCKKDNVGNCNLAYTVSNKYWYLPISTNIKLFITHLEESKKQVFLLIEEKKFANEKGSEFILIDLKIKEML